MTSNDTGLDPRAFFKIRTMDSGGHQLSLEYKASPYSVGLSYCDDCEMGFPAFSIQRRNKYGVWSAGADLVTVNVVNGNVGIGTNLPERKLEVASAEPQIKIRDSGSTSEKVEFGYDSGTNDLNIKLFAGTKTQKFQIYYADPVFSFDTNTTPDAMVIKDNGKVGIGTNNPQALLSLKTPSSYPLSVMDIDVITFGTTTNAKNSHYFRARDLGAIGGEFIIKGDGHVGIGTSNPGDYSLYVNGTAIFTSHSDSSDIRWKKNITPLENSLEKITQLQGVNYEWKTEEYPEKNFTEEKQIGVIAQNVEKVIPELVSTDNEGYKAVSYSKITAVLIEAVKEQQAQITALQSQVEELKSQISNMQQ
jgi:hypothetical protein